MFAQRIIAAVAATVALFAAGAATPTTASAGTIVNHNTGTAAMGTATKQALACTSPGQKLGNPGFEGGNAAWTATPGVITSSAGQPAHAGKWKAWLGGSGHTDTLAQKVFIPPGCPTYLLSFWLRITTKEGLPGPYDQMTVKLGATTLAMYSNLNENATYTQKVFNVSGFAGQAVVLKFTSTEDATFSTSFVVDDALLLVA